MAHSQFHIAYAHAFCMPTPAFSSAPWLRSSKAVLLLEKCLRFSKRVIQSNLNSHCCKSEFKP
eukprot:1754099-Pleurochrysis_carterae.AAC.4